MNPLLRAMQRSALVLLILVSGATFAQTSQQHPAYTPPPPPPDTSEPTPQEPAPAPAPTAERSRPPPQTRPGDELEEERWRRTRVSVAPIPTVLLSPNLEFEYAFSPKFSGYVSPRASLAGLGLQALGVGNAWSAGLLGGVRYFPQAEAVAPAGLWLAAEVEGVTGRVEAESLGVNVSSSTISPMFLVGYTYIHENGFAFAGGGGIGARLHITDRANHPLLTYSLNDRVGVGPGLGIHLNIGYAF